MYSYTYNYTLICIRVPIHIYSYTYNYTLICIRVPIHMYCYTEEAGSQIIESSSWSNESVGFQQLFPTVK